MSKSGDLPYVPLKIPIPNPISGGRIAIVHSRGVVTGRAVVLGPQATMLVLWRPSALVRSVQTRYWGRCMASKYQPDPRQPTVDIFVNQHFIFLAAGTRPSSACPLCTTQISETKEALTRSQSMAARRIPFSNYPLADIPTIASTSSHKNRQSIFCHGSVDVRLQAVLDPMARPLPQVH